MSIVRSSLEPRFALWRCRFGPTLNHGGYGWSREEWTTYTNIFYERESTHTAHRIFEFLEGPNFTSRFLEFTGENRCVFVCRVVELLGGPTILVLLLAISRKGPLKCLLGGPRSRGSRFLGPSYRRRRPRRPISLDFSGLGWLFIEPQHMI